MALHKLEPLFTSRLATGLAYPAVPKGEEEIRFQLSAAHTPRDIAAVLEALQGNV